MKGFLMKATPPTYPPLRFLFKSFPSISLAIFALVVGLSTSLFASRALLIDDFSDGNLQDNPKWFSFGKVAVELMKNDPTEFQPLGPLSMRLSGETSIWYVGGVGVYLGIDATRFKFIKLLIRGNGPTSGSLQLELFDDDNDNRLLERNPKIPSQTLYDDKFIYTLDVNWSGWKVVIIPIDRFRDENPTIGDNIWNPHTKNGSGGLLQLQIVAFAHQEVGKVSFLIDSIRLY